MVLIVSAMISFWQVSRQVTVSEVDLEGHRYLLAVDWDEGTDESASTGRSCATVLEASIDGRLGVSGVVSEVNNKYILIENEQTRIIALEYCYSNSNRNQFPIFSIIFLYSSNTTRCTLHRLFFYLKYFYSFFIHHYISYREWSIGINPFWW